MMSGVAAAATAGDESSRPKGGGDGDGGGGLGGGDGEADGGGGNGGAAGGDGHVSFSHLSVSSVAQAHLLSLSLYAQGKYMPGYMPSSLPTKNLAEHSTVARSSPHDTTCTLPAS